MTNKIVENMYVVVCTSCPNCNSQAVAIFSQKPSQEQIDKVAESIGGMRCIQDRVYRVSRELSLAITKLEEAMFWANSSIARNE